MELAFTLVCSAAGLWFAVYLAKWVLQNDEGTKEMQNISNAIREGAEAFLARQYKTIAMLTVPVAVVIYLLYALRQGKPVSKPSRPFHLRGEELGSELLL